VGHLEGDKAVLDVIRGRRPPFDPSAVVAEHAALLQTYGVHEVRGDHYGGEWPAEAYRKAGIGYRPSEVAKSAIYLESLVLFSTGRVRLLDNRTLLTELRQLERRTARSGKDSVDHPPKGHDDLANAACGVLWLLAAGRRAMTAAELAEHAKLLEEASEGARGEAERAFALRNGGGSGDPLNSGFRGYGPGGWPSRFDGDL